MRTHAQLMRSETGLTAALRQLEAFPQRPSAPTPDAITAANAALVARLIVTSALLRQESRGAHFRADFPHTDASWRVHLLLARGQAPLAAETIAGVEAELAQPLTR
jgi:L-aspartate oxidase